MTWPLLRLGLPRWPAVSADGVALGNVVMGCGCPVDGVCTRAECPHRAVGPPPRREE